MSTSGEDETLAEELMIPDATLAALVNQLDNRLTDVAARLDRMRAESISDNARIRDDLGEMTNRINAIESREDVRLGREQQTEQMVTRLSVRGSLAIAFVAVLITVVDRIAAAV